MYRKRFEPQRSCLPGNYSGWAAEHTPETECREEAPSKVPAIPCKAEKHCGDPNASNLTDMLLIGAVILTVLLMNKDGKPDLSLLIPLGILLVR